jgi:hypothetical protein
MGLKGELAIWALCIALFIFSAKSSRSKKAFSQLFSGLWRSSSFVKNRELRDEQLKFFRNKNQEDSQ